MEQFYEILVPILTLWGFSILLLIAHLLIKYLKLKVKNTKVQLILEFAEQAVSIAETLDLTGSEKKRNAMLILNKRLKNNKLLKNVTAEQIDQYIEKSVQVLNSNKNKIENVETIENVENIENVDTSSIPDSKSLSNDEVFNLL